MPELIPPVMRVHRSFLAAMAELRTEGRGTAEAASMTGRDPYGYGGRWSDPEKRRLIEKSGAVCEDRRGSKLRYWLTTTDEPTAPAVRPHTGPAPAPPRLP
ncbi:hypothetical protein [Streptomyces xiaopingdaonensis]|uniref:hypothetical protein n=1 Tax=Streptomyces xiaopingdaonensis TaxID=1565415 RepID=UPI0002DA0936|nr:hypothetical protein [Streptomyces xiaopingdaonensis]